MNVTLEKKTVSIVDDDVAVGDSIRELLRSVGLVANVFISAGEFLSSKDLAKTSCVISDIKMPGIGGLELQKRLIEKGYRFPIIFISALDNEKLRKSTERSGAICFLIKPFSEDDLLSCVRSALSIEID